VNKNLKSKLTKKYSGPLSERFWHKISKISNKKKHDRLYHLGCALQTLESVILEELEGGNAK